MVWIHVLLQLLSRGIVDSWLRILLLLSGRSILAGERLQYVHLVSRRPVHRYVVFSRYDGLFLLHGLRCWLLRDRRRPGLHEMLRRQDLAGCRGHNLHLLSRRPVHRYVVYARYDGLFLLHELRCWLHLDRRRPGLHEVQLRD